MSETLEDILNDCLERLAQGENVAECVGRYPDRGDELMPLLEVAASAIDTASSVSYRPEAKARGLQRLTAALAQREEPARARLLPGLTWRPRVSRPVAAGLIAALLTTGMAFGATTASSGSVPGEPLYLVKTAKENIFLMVPQSDMKRAKTHIRLAGVRGQEMRKLMAKQRFDEAEKTADRIRHHLNVSAGFMGLMTSSNTIEMPHRPATLIKNDKVFREVMGQLQHNLGFLRSRLPEDSRRMPAPHRKRADMIRWRSEMVYRTIVAAMEEADSPSWQPLWREEPPRPRGR